MGTSATKSKQRWNSSHYAQVKAYVDPEIASAFKAACAASGVSMNGALSQFMSDYCKMQKSAKELKAADFLSSKGKRRKKHEELLRQYMQLRDAQERANDNVPDNFQDTERFEASLESVRIMDEAIEMLEDAY